MEKKIFFPEVLHFSGECAVCGIYLESRPMGTGVGCEHQLHPEDPSPRLQLKRTARKKDFVGSKWRPSAAVGRGRQRAVAVDSGRHGSVAVGMGRRRWQSRRRRGGSAPGSWSASSWLFSGCNTTPPKRIKYTHHSSFTHTHTPETGPSQNRP